MIISIKLVTRIDTYRHNAVARLFSVSEPCCHQSSSAEYFTLPQPIIRNSSIEQGASSMRSGPVILFENVSGLKFRFSLVPATISQPLLDYRIVPSVPRI